MDGEIRTADAQRIDGVVARLCAPWEGHHDAPFAPSFDDHRVIERDRFHAARVVRHHGNR
jgi:hypothetical protein